MLPGTIKYKTPITYYGGKQRIASWVCRHIPPHRIYVEPFFGGGAVFFAKQPSFLEVINDKDKRLIEFWEVAQNDFEKLAAGIYKTLHSEAMYKRALYIYHGSIQASRIQRAVATWLVFNQSWNATTRGGWKYDNGSGGSHSGIVQHHFRQNFCPWIEQRLQNVQISCRDALKVIRDRDTSDTFFYLDPPYPGTNQGHYSGYTIDHLQELLELLQHIQGKFALSNYQTEIITQYSVRNGWTIDTLSMKKDSRLFKEPTAQKTEILLMNYNISVPQQIELF